MMSCNQDTACAIVALASAAGLYFLLKPNQPPLVPAQSVACSAKVALETTSDPPSGEEEKKEKTVSERLEGVSQELDSKMTPKGYVMDNFAQEIADHACGKGSVHTGEVKQITLTVG